MRIAIGVPVPPGWPFVHIEWALALRRLVVPGEAVVIHPSVPDIATARNAIVREALRRGCDYIFFLDSDVIPPPDAIVSLMKHGLPIVSGLYYIRTPRIEGRPHPAMWRKRPDGGYSPVVDWEPPDALIDVDAVGMGCCLIHRSVFERLDPPWFVWTYDEPEPGKQVGIGEDFYLCKRIREELKLPIFVDTSVRCKHVALLKSVGYKGLGWFEP